MLLGVLFPISGAVRATTLIELRAAGEPVRRKEGDALRMVIDAERQRALIATPRGQSVIDLERKCPARRCPADADRAARRRVMGRLSGHAVGP